MRFVEFLFLNISFYYKIIYIPDMYMFTAEQISRISTIYNVIYN